MREVSQKEYKDLEFSDEVVHEINSDTLQEILNIPEKDRVEDDQKFVDLYNKVIDEGYKLKNIEEMFWNNKVSGTKIKEKYFIID